MKVIRLASFSRENGRFVDSRSDTINGQKFIIYQSSSIDELDRVSTRYCNDGKDEIPCELIDSFTTKNPSFLFQQIESFRYSNTVTWKYFEKSKLLKIV